MPWSPGKRSFAWRFSRIRKARPVRRTPVPLSFSLPLAPTLFPSLPRVLPPSPSKLPWSSKQQIPLNAAHAFSQV